MTPLSRSEALVERLNAQIARHSPASRFITLFFGVYDPVAGDLTYVNAGQNPPLIRRGDGRYERLTATGVALGMFEGSKFSAERTVVLPGELLVLYSDGITEAENPAGQPFEETGLRPVIGIEIELRDLRSRLRAVPSVSFLPPDDQLFRALIVKFCADRQLAVDETVVAYLATRIERSYAAVRQAVELLDAEALRLGRPVTRALAAELLRKA